VVAPTIVVTWIGGGEVCVVADVDRATVSEDRVRVA
jgi:hypothetical protein